MKTFTLLSRNTMLGSLETTIFLLVVTAMVVFNQTAFARTANQSVLPNFCDANALRAFPEMPGSLKCMPAPEPYMLDSDGNAASIMPGIIKNKANIIALGKILFWDSQVGSDGLACASCHFQAGADNRIKNQINPGMRNASGELASDGKTPTGFVFDFMGSLPNTTYLDPLLAAAGKGPNHTLTKDDFPLRKYLEPESPVEGQPAQADRNAEVVYDSDDVISSQGVFFSKFNKLDPSGRTEVCQKRFPTKGLDKPLFNVSGYSVRQVEPRNTPTVINAVYNFRNFWDGRANNVFNGLDPFGMRRFADPAKTPSTEIYVKNLDGSLSKQRIQIYNASLASQAVGPALSDMEMSCAGKSFVDLGRKMLNLKPLNGQTVDPTDSVLGPYSKPGTGLKPIFTYKLLIQKAFNDSYWNAPDSKKIDGYTLMENNFSLFWGLAIQAYEATLVSNNSRFDQAQEDLINGRNKLTEQEQHGLNLFFNEGKCIACHLGSEFTAASVSHVSNPQNNPDTNKYIERMLMGDGGIALYDAGFYNIGVRPTKEDVGVGAADPYGFPLSFTRNAKAKSNDPTDFSIENPNFSSLFPDPIQTDSSLFATDVGCINWNSETTPWGQLCGTDPVVRDERDAVDGAFKTPSLRNVELTGPYFHNGGQATLEQVVQFYNRGGDRKDLFQKDQDCGGALFTQDSYGNQVVAADSESGLIDNSGFLVGSGQQSNIAPDMAGTKELVDTTCNSAQSQHETLDLSNSDVDDLVAFLKTLTDERVRWEQAPFDHPSLKLPNGHVGDEVQVQFNAVTNQALDATYTLPSVGYQGRGAKGLQPLSTFESGLR